MAAVAVAVCILAEVDHRADAQRGQLSEIVVGGLGQMAAAVQTAVRDRAQASTETAHLAEVEDSGERGRGGG